MFQSPSLTQFAFKTPKGRRRRSSKNKKGEKRSRQYLDTNAEELDEMVEASRQSP
jgi:hypothetical protein